jgi:biopolymer transport protein ExbB
MKYFHSIILTGLMVHVLPFSAQNAQAKDALPLTALAFVGEINEVPQITLEEEISLLDEEFEEFGEELSSLEDAILENEEVPVAIAEYVPDDTEEFSDEVGQLEELPIALEAIQETSATSTEEFEAEPTELIQLELADLPLIKKTSIFLESPGEDTQATLEQDAPAILDAARISIKEESARLNKEAITVDLKQAFAGSPVIYSLLLAMSVFSVCIWLYSLLCMRSSAQLSDTLLKNVQNRLNSNNFEEALSICSDNSSLFCKMVSSGIHSRRHGLPIMIEAMRAEGKRSTVSFWQKIGMLNDIAIIAPMLGLLGTVLGMFYAFYDVNRSIESVSTLFDGLGVSVGTTVAGLIVAILALILHSTAKYSLVRALAQVERETQNVATLIDDRTSIYK